jgi:hydrogenase maturation protein HypF
MNERWRIEVRGVVQGVGFRPFVYRLARRLELTGNVRNHASGVSIEIEGPGPGITSFLTALPIEAPAVAQLVGITQVQIDLQQDDSFSILESNHSGQADTFIPPDIATCAECLAEMLGPANRRYRYPLINCTNCGPRFTITRSIPYDRSQTSMASFIMCPPCQAEYDDPVDRRFHTQPNACWDCGPQLALLDPQGQQQPGAPVEEAIRRLRKGAIIAIKGLGGFHLAVDASNPDAVGELRRRKRRGKKPFALMCADLAAVQEVCEVSAQEAVLLESPQRPIVLLRKTSAAYDALAPDGSHLGVFLPYTPLHHLLLANKGLRALVMTSGNLSDEPIAITNDEAFERLARIADFFLIHNRDILLRCDDSVVRVIGNQAQFARRSRGFVPSPVLLKTSGPSILAVGGELKNTICVSRGSAAFPGQHIGDLENLSAYGFFEESIAHFKDILGVSPKIIAHDLHPMYLSTQWAKRQAGARLVGVQHHHAHIAGCMAENQITGSVIGVALDGTGYGTDGQAWGGEVLIGSLQGFERVAHLAYVPMPGGVQVIHEPWRMAVSYLWQAFGEDWRSHVAASWIERIPAQRLKLVEQLLGGTMNLAMTSSCGRLFDAVSALTLGKISVTYEAQAAIALEACCNPIKSLNPYPFEICEDTIRETESSKGACLQIQTALLFAALTQDLRDGVAPGIISRRFHDGLISALTSVVCGIAQRSKLLDVCLSGGSFQNAQLLQGLSTSLTDLGMKVHVNKQIPPGDGGLSFGQLVVAAHRTRAESSED